MSNNLMAEYRKAFKMLDENDLGRISLADFSSLVASVGVKLTEAEIHATVRRVLGYHGDAPASIKCIDFPQFLSALSATITDCISDDEIRRIFREFDKDGDGFISPQELRALLLRLGDDVTESEIQEMMRVADLDGDGFVSLREFTEILSTDPPGIAVGNNRDDDVTIDDICAELRKQTSVQHRARSDSSIRSRSSMTSLVSSSSPGARHSSFELKLRNSKKKSLFGSRRRKSLAHWFKQR